MIFWITIAIIIIGCALMYLYDNTWFDYDWVYGCGLVITVVGVVVAVIMLFGIVFEYGCTDGLIAENTTRYETLVYQYKNDIYENDNDLGKRELMVDIQEWNENLAWKQAVQENFWIGIFYANIYDQFEFIELKEPTSDVQNSPQIKGIYLETEYEYYFSDLTQAANATGVSASDISMILRKELRQSEGWFFERMNGNTNVQN